MTSNCCGANVGFVDGDVGMCEACGEWAEVLTNEEE